MVIPCLGVDDANLAFVHGIADEVVFDVNVPRLLAGMPVVGHLHGLLVVFHDVDGVTLKGRHNKGLYLTEKCNFLHNFRHGHVLCFQSSLRGGSVGPQKSSDSASAQKYRPI